MLRAWVVFQVATIMFVHELVGLWKHFRAFEFHCWRSCVRANQERNVCNFLTETLAEGIITVRELRDATPRRIWKLYAE